MVDVYGTRCSFFCNVGYYLTGSSERLCMENGTWSGQTSACIGRYEAITCRELVNVLTIKMEKMLSGADGIRYYKNQKHIK